MLTAQELSKQEEEQLAELKVDVPPAVQHLLYDRAIRHWLLQLKRGYGRRNNAYSFSRFLAYVKENSKFTTASELIDSAMESKVLELQIHAELLDGYLRTFKIQREGTRSKQRGVVMSFYANNGVKAVPWYRLQRANDQIEIEDTSQEAVNFVEMVREVARSKCSAIQLAVLLTTYQSFMDDSTVAHVFNFFGFPQLAKHFGTYDWKQWDESKVPVRIDLVRPKSNVKGYTCLHRDAIHVLKLWLSKRFSLTGREIKIYPGPDSHKLPRSDPIFIIGGDDHPIPPEYVSHVFSWLGKRVGINVYTGPRPPKGKQGMIRHPLHSHEVRDCARSLAHPLHIDDEVEFFITHKRDVNGYQKSPWKDPVYYLQAYDKLAPWLNVLSCDPDKLKMAEELKIKEKEFQDKENKWYIESKKFQEELDSLKTVNRLKMEFDMETDPIKKHELGTRLLKLIS